jgi:hypothetical protein
MVVDRGIDAKVSYVWGIKTQFVSGFSAKAMETKPVGAKQEL